ncbi:MAG TPA: DUF924 family protein [Steroidobacteraceae bacterium]
MDQARKIREFWFGKLPLTLPAIQERMQFWFGGEDETPELRQQRDEAIRSQFEPLIERAACGELDSWADGPRRRLSLILLLDQFPRNIYRGTARAFAYDEKALGLTLSGMQSGADGALDVVERIFFYMPLQHAESLEVQDESVAAYRRLLAEAPESMREIFGGCVKYAEMHREIIARFGRFPHRNRVLNRTSTPEEIGYLRNAVTFGQ